MTTKHSETSVKHVSRVNAWREANRERYNAYMRAWRKRNPDKARWISVKGNRNYRAKNREKYREQARAYARRKRMGLSREVAEKMLDLQGGLCAICKVRVATHADHDHKTGVIRGMLCHQCNVVLGFASDSVMILEAAINYLKSFEE